MSEQRLIELADDVENIVDELATEIQARVCFCEEKHFMYDWEEEIVDSLHAALKCAQKLQRGLKRAADKIAG